MSSEAQPAQQQDGAEILIVDDSRTQAELLRYLLETRGYKVRATTNGKEALAAARERKPELIISDIVMPEMDGYQMCEAIKHDEAMRDIPVILAHADQLLAAIPPDQVDFNAAKAAMMARTKL